MITDLTASFNEELQCKAVTEQAEKSKIDMEARSFLFDGFNNNDDEMIESSATQAHTPKGINVEQLSKVWRLLNEVAQQKLYVTTPAHPILS